jgi:hypothetical protein
MSVFTVNLTFLAVNDRLLNALELIVSGNGSLQSTTAGRGDRRVRVDWLNPGDTMKIEVRIPDPVHPDRVPPVLEIQEDFVIKAIPASNGKTALGFEAATPPVHPRLGFPPGISVPDNGVLRIPLDVTFLDVTERFKVLTRTLDEVPRLRWPGATARVFEFMKASPRAWYLMIPDAVASPVRSEVQVLLFFRPETGVSYQNTDDAVVLLSGNTANATHFSFARYADPDSIPHTYLRPFAKTFAFGRYPNCDFAAQLVASAKNVIVAFPIPDAGGNFGSLTQGGALQATQELVLALSHEGIVAVDDDLLVPFLRRFGIAGFSKGGDAALTAWRQTKDSLDELYLFDPGQGLQGQDLIGWVRGGSQRRLQLICPSFSASDVARLPPIPPGQGNVRASNADYFFFDLTYKAAHGAREFARPGGSTTEASRESGILLIDERLPPRRDPGITLQGHAPNGGPSLATQALGLAEHEAAAMILGQVPRDDAKIAPPAADARGWSAIFDTLVHDYHENHQSFVVTHRHSWAVVGGEDTPARFSGFFELCLNESLFR